MKIVNKILSILIILSIIILICLLLKNKKINEEINNLNSTVYMVEEIENEVE